MLSVLSISHQSPEELNTKNSDLFMHPSDLNPIILTGLSAFWNPRNHLEKNIWFSPEFWQLPQHTPPFPPPFPIPGTGEGISGLIILFCPMFHRVMLSQTSQLCFGRMSLFCALLPTKKICQQFKYAVGRKVMKKTLFTEKSFTLLQHFPFFWQHS